MLILAITPEEAGAAGQLIDLEMGSPVKDRISTWHHLPGLLEKLQRARDPVDILELIGAIVTSPHGDVLSIIEVLKAAKYIP